MSPEYAAAYEKHNVASEAYRNICAAFQAQKIGYDEFFAARKVFDAATTEFDVAFAAEQNREDVTEEETNTDQTEFTF